MTHLARSGDGLLAALQMLALMQQAEQQASVFFNSFYPQRLENLRDIDRKFFTIKNCRPILPSEADMRGSEYCGHLELRLDPGDS